MQIERLNELLRSKLATLVSREVFLSGGLITITKVETTPDLKYSKVHISVLPENVSGTALELLRKNNAMFSKQIAKTTRIRKVPKFIWMIDDGERKMLEIDKIIQSQKS